MGIEYGDERLPERFWKKVHPCPWTGHWWWEASAKKKGKYASYTHERRVRLVTQVYAEVFFPEYPIDEYRPSFTCGYDFCVHIDHLKMVDKGECVYGHVNPERDSSGNCKVCKSNYDKNYNNSGRRKEARKRQPSRRNGSSNRPVSVFGDPVPTKLWRPVGFSPEPKIR